MGMSQWMQAAKADIASYNRKRDAMPPGTVVKADGKPAKVLEWKYDEATCAYGAVVQFQNVPGSRHVKARLIEPLT